MVVHLRLSCIASMLAVSALISACGGGDSATPAVVPNSVPIANAGPDQTIIGPGTVSFSGSGGDTDGTIKSYAWTQTGGPAVTLTGANNAVAQFTAPSVATDTVLDFLLTVTDDKGGTGSDSLRVTVKANALPTVNAGPDQTVQSTHPVTLTGASSDSDGTIASTTWTQLSGPSVTLSGTGASRAFTAPTVTSTTTLQFRYSATDDKGGVASDLVDVTLVPAIWEVGVPMTAARTGLTACTVNNKIYVFGGENFDTVTEEFDIATKTWTTKASFSVSRRYADCVVLGGKIYLIGSGYPLSAAVELYDPATDSWTSRAPMPTARGSMAVALVAGKIYAIGGSGSSPTGTVNANEEYDPLTNTWAAKANAPLVVRSGMTAVLNGKVYVCDEQLQAIAGPCYHYDPATNGWLPLSSIPVGRMGVGSGLVNGKMYVIGGSSGMLQGILPRVDQYDPLLNQWTAKTPMPTAREFVGSVTVGSDIYVLGGRTSYNPIIPSAAVEIYHTAADP